MFHALAPLTLWLTLALPAETAVGTGPEPAPAPVSWELEFNFVDPRRIDVRLPGADRTETYWYIVYAVVNNSGRSQRFFPMFQVVMEDLSVYETDTGINPLVFDAIRERHRITHPYLVPPSKAIGALLTGDDNARESVAVWRNIDLSVNEFRIYVAGLSGEMRTITNPAFQRGQPESQRDAGAAARPRAADATPPNFTLRKTLEIRYTLPGSPQARPGVLPERGEVRWILR